MPVVGGTPSRAWLRGFVDGLGRRIVTDTDRARPVEVLRLSALLSDAPGCARALADSIGALSTLDHPVLGPAPVLEQFADGAPAVVSGHLPGERLVEVLARTRAAGAPLTVSTILFVLRELIGAVRALHAAGLCHGAISPERVLVTPVLRVVLLDHALGGVLAAAEGGTPAGLWARFSVAVPAAEGLPAFSPLTDQLQVGLTGLAMFLGRPLAANEYPSEVRALAATIQETDLVGAQSPLGPMLREWLERMLLVSPNGPFPSMDAADGDLDILLSDDCGYVAAPLGIDVAPASLEPLSEVEAVSLGLVFATPAAAAREEPPLSLVPGDGEQPEDVPTPLSREPRHALADDGAPVASQGERPSLSLVPAPDPTANSERILELAHGLEGSRGRRAAQSAGPVPGASESPGRPAPRGLLARVRGGGWTAPVISAVAGVGILLMAGVAAGAYFVTSGRGRPARLVIESDPPGASIVLEGRTLGRTPTEVSLPRGGHVLEVQGRHSSQLLPIVLSAGEHRTERVTLAEAGPPGTLVITTEPPGVPVSVDGVPRGVAPLSLPLPPGHHVVAAANEAGRVRREIDVRTGVWVNVALAVSGWIDVVSPVPVRTTIAGRPMPQGVTRFAVAPGSHRVQFVNDEIGLRDSQDVVVEAGRSTEVVVAGTSSVLAITSNVPNTTVWIDGRPAGRTPLTTPLALGRHEIRFVHAEHGELRYEVFAKTGSSALHGDFGTVPRPSAPARAAARRR